MKESSVISIDLEVYRCSMNWRFIFSGLFLLACGSFIDNSRGVLLPILTEKFQLSYTQSSCFFILGNIGAVVATFLLLPLSHRFSEKRLAKVTAGAGIFGLVLGFKVSSVYTLMLFAIFLGMALSVYGALSNLFVIRGSDLHHRSKVMCGLHMVYGLTSIVAPMFSTWLLSQGVSWAGCLALVALMLLGVLIFMGNKIPEDSHLEDKVNSSLKLNGLQIWVVFVFCLYIAGEVLNSLWLVTFLTETKSISVGLSSRYLSGFFLLMTLTRALCFLSFKEEQESKLLIGCLLMSLMFFCLGHAGFLWAFPLAGVLGPFFPLFLGRVSRVFSGQSKVVTLWILGMGQLTLAISHWGVGKIATGLGIERAYWLPGILIFLSLLGYGVYLSKERRYLRGLH